MPRKKVVATAILPFALFGLTGCEASDADATSSRESYEVSRVRGYDTLEELMEESDLVVVAQVTDKYDVTEVHGLPFTRRTVTPTEIIKGTALDPLIVRVIGTPEDEGALVPGTTHLLYLKQFSFEPGELLDEYVVVGVYAGDYLQTEPEVFEKTDDESPELPVEVSQDEAVATLPETEE